MLLTISTTYYPASDLSYLLHKNPARNQEIELSAGNAHIFYPEVSDERCTVALLLDIDPIGLVRKASPGGNDFALEQYVNDRPYAASSFMSAALIKAFSTAMNGRCKDRPELVSQQMPFEVRISVLPVRGGEAMLRQLFEPLGYTVQPEHHPVDPAFPEWGNSRYFSVVLTNTLTLQDLLSHLYVLIPVCDNDKHYWVGQHEVEKLTEKGRDWLPSHPLKELIALRYLKHQRSLSNQALQVLLREEEKVAEEEDSEPAPQKVKVHDLRLQVVCQELLNTGARKVADLGCGEGRLLRLLMNEKQFDQIIGMDVSYRSLEIARDRLKLDKLPPKQAERVQLFQGSLTYKDKRIEGIQAAALVEVIEHLDEARLAALERSLFDIAHPNFIIITTPNADYNVKFPSYETGQMRHSDHRFEWTRAQFRTWADRLSDEHGYTATYKGIGHEDEEVGALTQMALFVRQGKAGDQTDKEV